MVEESLKTIVGKSGYASDLLMFKDDDYLMSEQQYQIEKTFADFHIKAEVIGMKRGANYNRYEVLPAPGVRISSIAELKDDIALRLAAPIRFIGLLPGEAAVFIDVAHYSNNHHTDGSNSVVPAEPQEDAIKILNEAERSFDYTIVDLNKALERLFDALEVLAERNSSTTNQ